MCLLRLLRLLCLVRLKTSMAVYMADALGDGVEIATSTPRAPAPDCRQRFESNSKLPFTGKMCQTVRPLCQTFEICSLEIH
jgi:hypothetical protein